MPPMTRRRPPTPAQRARIACGLTLEQVARYLRCTPAALDRLERAGQGWSYVRAVRLSQLYGCPIEFFPPAGPTRKLSPSLLRARRERERAR
jgi:transcriptional regulator with XRE-family HTH domain